MLAAGEVLLRARIIGVVVLACLVGASGAGAQTPSPDPAPVPPPPVVQPTPTPVPTTPEPSVREQPSKPRHKERPAPPRQTAVHQTFAEEVPSFLSSRTSAPKTRVVPSSAPVVATTGSRESPVVLILIFLLGSASLLIAVLKDVPVERLGAVPIVLSEHRSEMMYAIMTLLLGIGLGWMAALALK
jgi:hypothetical protein